MEIQGRHLIVALLAVLTYLSAATSGTALGQDATPVNIRATVPQVQPGRVAARVTVSKSRVRVGEWVMVDLAPPAGVNLPLFRVSFGDGREEVTRNRQIEHKYGRVGHYDIYAWVESEAPRPRSVPRVFLSLAPNPAAVGKPVTFNAQLANNYPGIKYRFVFGDKDQTAWQEQPQTTHAYALANTYRAYVDIGIAENGSIKPLGGSVREPIQVTAQHPDSVDLTANPTTVEVGRRVTFNARAISRDPNISYRFVFGDSSATGWQTNSQATHAYASPNTYLTFVQIRSRSLLFSRPIISSARKPIGVTPPQRVAVDLTVDPTAPTPTPTSSPTPTPASSPTPLPSGSASSSPGSSPTSTLVPPGTITEPSPGPADRDTIGGNWWKYLLIALLISFVAYRSYRFLFAPRPTFRPVPDAGGSGVDEATNPLAINSQILLRPDIADGLYRVSTDEPNLVRSIRREND